MDRRTICVKGVGRVSRAPDMVEVDMKISAANESYEKAVLINGQQLSMLQEAVEEAGLPAKDLKTSLFSVNPSYHYNDDTREKELTGYECSQRASISFPFRKELFSAVLSSLSSSMAEPVITLSFHVADQESLRDELLAAAVRDAAHKAQVLTKAAGQALGNMISINYSWDEVQFSSPGMNYMGAREEIGSASMDVHPEDVEGEESVTITWELKEEI